MNDRGRGGRSARGVGRARAGTDSTFPGPTQLSSWRRDRVGGEGPEKTPSTHIGKGGGAKDGRLGQGRLQDLRGPGQSENAGPLVQTFPRLSRWQQQNLKQMRALVRTGLVRLPGQAHVGPAVLARISKDPHLFP